MFSLSQERRERVVQNVIQALVTKSADGSRVEGMAREFEKKVYTESKSAEDYYRRVDAKLQKLHKLTMPSAQAPPANPVPEEPAAAIVKTQSPIVVSLPSAVPAVPEGAREKEVIYYYIFSK